MSQDQPKVRSTCDACQNAKVRCSRDKPICRRCKAQGRECSYSYSRRLGRPRRLANSGADEDPSQPIETLHDDLMLSEESIARSSGSRCTVTDLVLESSLGENDALSDLGRYRTPTLATFGEVDRETPNTTFTESGLNLGTGNDLGYTLDFDTLQFLDTSANATWKDISQLPHSEENQNSLASSVSAGRTNSSVSSLSILSSATSPGLFESTQVKDAGVKGIIESSPVNGIPGVHSIPESVSNDNNLAQTPFDIDFQDPNGTLQPVYSIPGQMTDSSMMDIGAMTNDSKYYSYRDLQCNCYVSVLRRLSYFNNHKFNGSSATIGLIMGLEKEVRTQTSEILECSSCLERQPRVLMLVGVMLENVVDVLEHIPIVKTGPRDHALFEKSNLAQTSDHFNKPGRPSAHITSVDNCALHLGGYEVSGDEKVSFIRHLIRTRLQELSSTIRRLHDHMRQNRDSLYFKAGTTMMVEIYQRLHSAISRLDNSDV